MTSPRIEILDRSNDQDYSSMLDELGARGSQVLAYHYPFYRDILTSIGVGTPLYLGAYHDSRLVGVLPGFLKTSEIGTCFCSMPFFGPNAGVICREDDQSERVHSSLLNFLLSYMQDLKSPLSVSIYTPFLFREFDYYRNSLKAAVEVDKTTQYLSVGKFQPDKKLRYDLRKAEKAGVVISRAESMDDAEKLYSVYYQNCLDYRIPPKPRDVVLELVSAGCSSRHVSTFIARHDREIVAGLIVLWAAKTASYYLPCVREDARTLQVLSLLVSHGLREAADRGITYWNWEASPSADSGVYKFKRKWGSEQGYYKIFVKVFKENVALKNLGKKLILDQFPYFYVYPFSELDL